MYLDNGREIYESDDYPGYYIDANTGAFCDENGNYVGGNIDNGDKPGRSFNITFNNTIVYVTKTGKQYYPKRTKTATIAMKLSEAVRKHYKPSAGYLTFEAKENKRKYKVNKK